MTTTLRYIPSHAVDAVGREVVEGIVRCQMEKRTGLIESFFLAYLSESGLGIDEVEMVEETVYDGGLGTKIVWHMRPRVAAPVAPPRRHHDQAVTKYPRIAELGLTIHEQPVRHVKNAKLNAALEAKGPGFRKRFGKLFGIQTCLIEGPYASDVEAVLERMATGRLIGSQKDWD